MTERTTIRKSLEDDAISITSTQSEEFSSSEEFLVERVLAEKKDARNRVIYLIFWAGYSEAQSTWEPRKNIQDPAILDAWKERKAEEAQGAKPTFDVAAFDAHAAEIERAKAERHRRRETKKRSLGIAVSSNEESDAKGHDNCATKSDSSEALETNELREDKSDSRRKAKRLRQRRDVVLTRDSSPEPSVPTPSILPASHNEDGSTDSSDLDRDPLVGNKKKAQRKALDAIRLSRLASNAPKASRDTDQPAAESAVQPSAQERNISAPQTAALLIGAQHSPHVEGQVQTQAQATPKPSLTRIPKFNRRSEQQPQSTQSTGAIQRPSVNPSAARGKGATRGGHLARRNVFEHREPLKKRRTFIETASDPNQEQRLFGSWHMRRKAELAGRSIADAAPDVTALGGLFTPSDPASFQALRPDNLRKRSSIVTLQAFDDSQLPADQPIVSTTSRPAYIYDRHGDNAVCYFWHFNDCSRGFDCRFLHSEDPNLPIAPAPGKVALSATEQETTRALAHSKRRIINEICFYWNKDGACSKGADCRFVHDNSAGHPVASDPTLIRAESRRYLDKKRATCKYWLNGHCKKGENCPYLHSASNADLSAPAASQPGPQNNTSYIIRDSDPMLAQRKDVEHLDKRSRKETNNLNRLEHPADSDLANYMHSHSSNATIRRNLHLGVETLTAEKIDTVDTVTRKTTLSLDEYRNNYIASPYTDRIKEVIFGLDKPQSVLVDFGEIDAQKSWVQIFSACPVFRFGQICTAHDFRTFYADNQRMILWGGNLAVNPADRTAVDKLNKFGLHLRIYCGGLISVSAEFTILIYPAMEEWKTVAPYSGFSQEDRVKYLIFRPSLKIEEFLSVKGAASRPFERNLAKHSHGLSYRQLKYAEKEVHHFYLMFPSRAKSTAAFFALWLQACDQKCKVYSSETQGSWLFFAKSSDIFKVGAVLFHESVIPSIPELPLLSRLLGTTDKKMFSFWCIDDSGGRYPIFQPVQTPNLGQMSITRIFPHGHAVFLTPSFLVAEPERARHLMSWFRERLKKVTPGTWKLVCAYDIRTYLLNLANEKALERDQFMEQNHDKPAKDAMAGKRGLSYQTCENRYKCHHIISGIIEENMANQLADPCDWDQLVDIDSPIVFAAASINPDNEPELITWFAGWSLMHLDKFRKFTVVGTNSSSHESAIRLRNLMDKVKMTAVKSSASGPSMKLASVLISPATADNGPVYSNADPKNPPSVSNDHPSKTNTLSDSSDSIEIPPKENDPTPANIEVGEMDVFPDPDGAIVSQIRAVDPESTPDLLLFCSTTGCSLRTAQEYLSNAANNFSRAVNLYSIHNRDGSADRLNVDISVIGLIDSVKAEKDRQLPLLDTGTIRGYLKASLLPNKSPGTAISSPGVYPHSMSPTWQPSPSSFPNSSSSPEDPKSHNLIGFKVKSMAKTNNALSSARSKAVGNNENGSRPGSLFDSREPTEKCRADEVVGTVAISRDVSMRGSYHTPNVLSPLAGDDSPENETNEIALANKLLTHGGLSETSETEFRYGSTTAWYRRLMADDKAWGHIYVDSWENCFKHIGLH